MKRKKCSTYAVGLAVILFAVVSTVFSAPAHYRQVGAIGSTVFRAPVHYRQVGTIAIPGSLSGGFDISWVDAVAGRYYLADRGTTSIDVIDTKHLRYLYSIPLHAAGNGADLSLLLRCCFHIVPRREIAPEPPACRDMRG